MSQDINFANLLPFSKAKTQKESTPGLTNDGDLVIYWDNLPKITLEDAADWVITNRVTVADFTVEYRKYDGTWRTVNVTSQYDSQNGGVIVHQLRYGYITSLVTGGVIDWTEARLAPDMGTRDLPAGTCTVDPGGTTPENYLIAQWVNVSPSHVQTIVATILTLNADTAFDPVIKGQTYPTTYHRINCISKIVEDGSAVITLFLGRPEYCLQGFKTWLTQRREDITYHWNVPKTLAQKVLDAEKGVGKTALASYNQSQGLVDIVVTTKDFTGYSLIGLRLRENCDSNLYKDFYWGVSDPSVYTLPAGSSITSGDTYEMVVDNQQDGTYDVGIIFHHTKLRTYPTRSHITSTLDTIYEYKQWGAPGDTYMTNIDNPPQGYVYEQNFTPRDDCTRDIVLTTDLSKEQIIPFEELRSAFKSGDGILYKNARTIPDLPDVTGTGVYQFQLSINRDGTYDGTEIYRKGNTSGIVSFDSNDSLLKTEESTIYKSSPSMIVKPAEAVQGEIIDVHNSITEEGLYDGGVITRTSVSDTFRTKARRSGFKQSDGIIYVNGSTIPNIPDVFGSGVYVLNVDENQDGTYNSHLMYTAGSNSGIVSFASQNAVLQEEDSIIYKDVPGKVDAQSFSIGAVYGARNSITEDGTYDATLTYTQSKPGVYEFTSQHTPIFEEITQLYKNNLTPIGNAPSGQGKIYAVRQSMNVDGTYDGASTCGDFGSGLTIAFPSMQSKLLYHDDNLYFHSANKLSAPNDAVGLIYVASNSIQEDGTYDGTIEARASISDIFSIKTRRSGFKQSDGIIYVNGSTIPNIPDVSGSGVYVLNVDENQDGTYNSRLMYTAGSNAGIVSFASQNAVLQEEDSIIYKDAQNKADAASPSIGAVYSARNSITEDGTYDASLVYTQSKPGLYEFTSQHTPIFEEITQLYKNNLTPIGGASSVQGKIYAVRQSMNVDGTYDGASTCRDFGSGLTIAFPSMQSKLLYHDDNLYFHSANKLFAPNDAVGLIYVASNSIQEDGTYDGTIEARASISDIVSIKTRRSGFKQSDGILYRNSATIPDLPDVTGSGIYTLSLNENQDGTYDGNILYTAGTATGLVGFASQNAILQDEDRVIYKDANAKIDADAASIGNVYRAHNTITEDGTYDATLIYEQNKSGNKEFLSEHTLLMDETSRLYKNHPTSLGDAPAAVVGAIYSVRQSMNIDGTYDGMTVCRNFGTGANTLFPNVRADLLYRNERIYFHSPNVINADNDSIGTIYTADNTFLEDGSYSGNLVATASVPHELYISWGTHNGNAGRFLYGNQRTFPSAALTGLSTMYNNSVSPSRNTDGTYDVVIDITPTQSSTSSGDWDNKKYRWRTWSDEGVKRGDPGIYVENYIFNTTSLDTARKFLDDIVSDGPPKTTDDNHVNLKGTAIHWKTGNRWQAVRFRKTDLSWRPNEE